MDNKKDTDTSEDMEIIESATKKISDWYTYFGANYTQARMDKRFCMGEQWTQREQADLQRLQMPTPTFNMMYPLTKALIGEFREAVPSLQVRSQSQETLLSDNTQQLMQQQKQDNLVENLIRNLAFNADAKVAWEQSYSDQIRMGMGAVQICYRYVHPTSFKKRPFIERVEQPEMAFFDPMAKEPTKTDGDFAGVIKWLSKKDLINRGIENPVSINVYAPNFMAMDKYALEDRIIAADFYKKCYYTTKLLEFSDGTTIEEDKLDEYLMGYVDAKLPLPRIINSRIEHSAYYIMHYELIGNCILDQGEFPAKTLPVYFADGDSEIFDGYQKTRSMVEGSIDSQRLINYLASNMIQNLKTMRREQWVVDVNGIPGELGRIWESPECQQGALPWNSKGNAQMPQKIAPSELSQSLFAAYNMAAKDLQTTMGVFGENFGAPDPTAGHQAIALKDRQGTSSTALYINNLVRVQEAAARTIMEMLPTIFDRDQEIVPTMKQDGTTENVNVTSEMMSSIKNNSYHVHIESSINYKAQQQQALQLLLQLMELDPPTYVPVLSDLVGDNMDVLNRPQIVERLRTVINPNIIAQENGQPPPQPPPAPIPPMVQIKQQELALKQQTLQQNQQRMQIEQQDQALKARDQQIEVMGLQQKAQESQNESGARQYEALAENYKSALNYKSTAAKAQADLIKSLQPKPAF
jgi:hypothetical protein